MLKFQGLFVVRKNITDLSKTRINTTFSRQRTHGLSWLWSEIMRKKNKVYVTLNPAERRLLIQGLLSFRSKVIARGIDTVDIDRVLEKEIR